jgi:CheY-like chemotaxis protein/HPt (histidine-containing phosphotransfer) domain-containing protein
MSQTKGSNREARTLLVVADKADTQNVILEHAEAQGHSVISASNPALGLSTFDMSKVDIVITDLFLPDHEGIMLVKQIRERRPSCPILLLTDAGHGASTQEGLRAGALDYVEQPIRQDAFAQALNRAIHSLPASTVDETVVLDLCEALSRVSGDQDLFYNAGRQFVQESPKEAAAARAALERQDGAGLSDAAHRLKVSAMTICSPRLFASAKRLEELGRQGKFAEASPVCAEFEARLAEVHAALRELIAGGLPSWWLQLVRLYKHVPCSS